MEADNYFWLPNNPRFMKKRKIQERIAMMEQDIEKHETVGGKLILCRKLTVDTSLPLSEIMAELDRILKGEDL